LRYRCGSRDPRVAASLRLQSWRDWLRWLWLRDVGFTERLSDRQSTKPVPIAQLTPPARTQIVAFDVLSGPINKGTDTFTLRSGGSP
jgi:hypothetical protein